MQRKALWAAQSSWMPDASHARPLQVSGFTGDAELGACLKGADVVVIPAGVPR